MNMKKYHVNPASIQRQDSNSRLLEHKSSPITTRRGFPPSFDYLQFLIRSSVWTLKFRDIPEAKNDKAPSFIPRHYDHYICTYVCLSIMP